MSKASEWIEKAQWVEENTPRIDIGRGIRVEVDMLNQVAFIEDEDKVRVVLNVMEVQQFIAWFKENFEDGTTPEVRKDN